MPTARRSAYAEACLIGLVSALAAVLLKHCIGWLGTLRVHASIQLPAPVILPLVGLSLGFFCGWLLELLAPESTGSGIPQVKAVLAQFPVALNLRVALVKLVATILAVGSGLTIGRQGPTVHIGAAVAAQLSLWVPTSPDHRRQMIAAGAGAGLAAAFNAPIAGVLFIVEELLQDLSGLTLGTAILASFIGAVVSRLLGGRSLDLNLELTELSSSFFAPEIPFYLLLGLLAGLLGGLFNKGILASLTFYRRLSLSLPLKIGLAGFASGCVVALLPVSFRNNSGLRELLVTGEASWEFASIAFVAHFVLTLVAYGSGAPGGLFNPALILGSALGYLVGLCEYHMLGISLPTTYALAGMGAFFSAVSKAPITAIVIVFEMTADFNLVLPLMISGVVSYLVGDQVSKGSLYQRLLEWNGYTLPKATTVNQPWAGLTAADLMQRQVETLSTKLPLDEAVQAFSRSHHRGFPVVDDGKLVGIVTQTDLAKATQRQMPGHTPLEEIMTPRPVTVSPSASLVNVLYVLNRYELSRLPVTEARKLVGIITRSDLIRAQADKLSGRTGGRTGKIEPLPEPSYVVYQTRSPQLGKGRLLVPLANPQTAQSLLQLAAAMARDRHYELECLQVIVVPRHSSPDQTAVNTTKSRRLLRQAESLAQEWDIPIHTQIRVTHDVANAILETIKERHIDLILMGWTGSTSTPSRIFGSVVDTLIRQASCDVVLVKLGDKIQHQTDLGLEESEEKAEFSVTKQKTYNSKSKVKNPKWNRWLVPTAGGPNAQQALQLLPSLVSASDSPEISLCQVFHPSLKPDTTDLYKSAQFLSRRLGCPVKAVPVRSTPVSESVIQLTVAENSDVVVLGASREGLLQQVIQGNIPEAIARGCDCTVILVRSALNN
jgi:CIC family chloride channel protein